MVQLQQRPPTNREPQTVATWLVHVLMFMKKILNESSSEIVYETHYALIKFQLVKLLKATN